MYIVHTHDHVRLGPASRVLLISLSLSQAAEAEAAGCVSSALAAATCSCTSAVFTLRRSCAPSSLLVPGGDRTCAQVYLFSYTMSGS